MPAQPTTANRASRQWDGRKTAQDDGSRAIDKNPPHGHLSHGPGRFLIWMHPGTPIDPEIFREKFRYWDEADPPRKDPAPTWDSIQAERWTGGGDDGA